MPKTNKKSGFLQTYPYFNWGNLGVLATFGLNRRLLKAGLLACFMLAFSMQVALAQERTISGKVVDASGSVIPGISVYVKGTNKGTVTDVEGNFQLVVTQGSVLVVQGVGYKSTEMTVGSESTISISVEDDITSLSEVTINSGYTIDSRRETTGSVSTVKAKDLTIVPSGNVEQQLQGRVAGVTVISNGQPGTASQIRVRGFGAFGGNEPLYVVDGVPVGDVGFLNPDDIETTTVLKDAAAASIYGARAANGVIVYTTKRGTKEAKRLSVTYDGLVGFTDPGKSFPMMNPQEYADWSWQRQRNDAFQANTPVVFSSDQFGNGQTPQMPNFILVGTGANGSVFGNIDLAAERAKYNVTVFDDPNRPIYQVVRPNLSGTDWYDAITRTAPITRHTLGISGGGENSRFYVGMSLQDQDGILIHQKFKRYTFRVNTEFNILKNLRIGQNLQFTYNQTRLLQGGSGGRASSADENPINQAYRMPTIIPVYDEFGGYAGTRAKGFNNPANPVAALDGQADNRGFGVGGFGNVYLEFEPIKGLIVRSSIGGQYSGYYFNFYGRRSYENKENNGSVNYGEGAGTRFAWVLTNTASYKKVFGKHSISALVGQEALNTGSGRDMGGSGLNPFSQDRNFVTLDNVNPRVVNSSYERGVNFASYFGKIDYAFNDKYLASVVIRRDGSSRFGSLNKYGVFPAFSVAWRISSESFMKSLEWISDLKIRGGYGIMGNSNNVNPQNQYSLFGSNPVAYAINGGNSGASAASEGFARTRIGNPAARWEKAITTNIGFDGTFLKGKLDVIVDFWRKDTKDLLFERPVSVQQGPFARNPAENVGSILNQGLDIQVITRGNIKEVNYELTVNGGFLKNEITELAPGITSIPGFSGDYRGLRPVLNQLGYSLSAFYGFQVQGLFKSQAEVDAAPQQVGVTRTQDATAENKAQGSGRFRYADLNGDNVINTQDRTFLGSPVPKFQGGVNINLKYKNFEFNTYMFLSLGNKIFNASKLFTDFYALFPGASISQRVRDSWTPQNPDATIPIFESAANASTTGEANSYYIEDGSYFRMQNITLAYNFPTNILNKLKMQRLRVFVGTNNVFTITKYSGLDPSVGGAADTNFGIDLGNFPITRQVTMGVNVGF
jgi:TonB-dependent starch-binding outer membrane protein SusC